MSILFKKHLSSNHFECWHASNQGVTCELQATTRAVTRLGGKIFRDPLFEAFNQCAFTTFSVFKQLAFAVTTKDINRCAWAFFVGFCHLEYDT